MQNKKPSVRGVWIFSGTAHCQILIELHSSGDLLIAKLLFSTCYGDKEIPSGHC